MFKRRIYTFIQMDSLYIQCMRKMYYNNTMMFIFFVNLERKFVHCILLFQRFFREIRCFIRHNGQKYLLNIIWWNVINRIYLFQHVGLSNNAYIIHVEGKINVKIQISIIYSCGFVELKSISEAGCRKV